MIPRLRTIAILMLLAGLSLGIFASRALRAMGPADERPRTTGQPAIERRAAFYADYYRLDDEATDRIRRELYRLDRRVRDRLWTLREEHAGDFEAFRTEATERIQEVLSDAESKR